MDISAKHKKAPVKILGFDTIWKNNLPQKIKSLFFKFKYGHVFDYVFVPGTPQKELALNMGFKIHQIKTGAYTCDFDFFRSIGEKLKCKKINFYLRDLFTLEDIFIEKEYLICGKLLKTYTKKILQIGSYGA